MPRLAHGISTIVLVLIMIAAAYVVLALWFHSAIPSDLTRYALGNSCVFDSARVERGCSIGKFNRTEPDTFCTVDAEIMARNAISQALKIDKVELFDPIRQRTIARAGEVSLLDWSTGYRQGTTVNAHKRFLISLVFYWGNDREWNALTPLPRGELDQRNIEFVVHTNRGAYRVHPEYRRQWRTPRAN